MTYHFLEHVQTAIPPRPDERHCIRCRHDAHDDSACVATIGPLMDDPESRRITYGPCGCHWTRDGKVVGYSAAFGWVLDAPGRDAASARIQPVTPSTIVEHSSTDDTAPVV